MFSVCVVGCWCQGWKGVLGCQQMGRIQLKGMFAKNERCRKGLYVLERLICSSPYRETERSVLYEWCYVWDWAKLTFYLFYWKTHVSTTHDKPVWSFCIGPCLGRSGANATNKRTDTEMKAPPPQPTTQSPPILVRVMRVTSCDWYIYTECGCACER